MSDQFNQPPVTPEKLDFTIRVAVPDDWEALRELRLEALSGPEKHFFGSDPDKKFREELLRTEADYRDSLSQKDIFFVFCKQGSVAAGMGMAKMYEAGEWWMGHAYMRENYRGNDFGKKMFAYRLNEIIKRAGKEVRLGVAAINARTIHIAESFGFKKVEEGADEYGFMMELKDVNDPKMIGRINKVLNAG